MTHEQIWLAAFAARLSMWQEQEFQPTPAAQALDARTYADEVAETLEFENEQA